MIRIMYSGHNPISKQSINFDGGEGEEEKEDVDNLHRVFLSDGESLI